MPLAPALRQALVDGLRRLYGERLLRAVLFGSEARGEATADSNVDILVVLAGEVDTAAEARRLSDLGLDVLLEFGRLVRFVVMEEEVYRQGDRPLLRNVRVGGVNLYCCVSGQSGCHPEERSDEGSTVDAPVARWSFRRTGVGFLREPYGSFAGAQGDKCAYRALAMHGACEEVGLKGTGAGG